MEASIVEMVLLSSNSAHRYFEIKNSEVTNNSIIKFSLFHTDSIIDGFAKNNNIWNSEVLRLRDNLHVYIIICSFLFELRIFSYLENDKSI